jgi:NAD(P)H-nitrite reductase large subunit
MQHFCSIEDCNTCSGAFVCRCFRISEAELVEAVVTLELKNLKDVRRRTGAGDGSTACHERIMQLMEQHAYASSSPICSDK